MTSPRKVLVFGTFDGVHDGHRFFLDFAKKQGESLVVSLADDDVVMMLKGKSTARKQEKRMQELLATGLPDKVVFGDRDIGNWGAIRTEMPAIVVVGYDQTRLLEALRDFHERENQTFSIVVAPSFEGDTLHSSLLSK